LRGYIKPLNDGNLLCAGMNSAALTGRCRGSGGGARQFGVRNGVSGLHGARGGGDVGATGLLGGILVRTRYDVGVIEILECGC
jgi:hypothetical protein